MSVSINGTNGLVFNDASSQNTSAFTGGLAFRNRIINGAMVIDQRNGGASVTPTNSSYGVDRWQYSLSQASKLTAQQSTTAPVGFTQSNLITSSSAYSVGASEVFLFRQRIEGLNVSDLGWGTANAKTVTLSFWVRSSLTGTFGGAIRNNAQDRSYPFSYTIIAANTFEYKTITIAGDTSGTWTTDNTTGVEVNFSVGAGSSISNTAGAWVAGSYASATGATSVVGTNGATFYITGVQLEKGSTATSFDYRPFGTELSLCQRYFTQIGSPDGTNGYAVIADGRTANATSVSFRFKLPVAPRTTPSASISSATYAMWQGTTNLSPNSISINSSWGDGCEGDVATTGATTGAYVQWRGNAAGTANKPFVAFSMEL